MERARRVGFHAGLAWVLISIVPGLAAALPLASFECITSNVAGDCAIGEAQLAGELVESDPGEFVLIISNSGPDDAVVASIYLESLLISGLGGASDAGVSFSVGGAPPVLPGAGQTFAVGAFISADPAPPKMGIGPGESGRFLLSVGEGTTLEDLATSLRLGVHVIAFASGGSESFITSVPEPSQLLLAALTLLSVIGFRMQGPER